MKDDQETDETFGWVLEMWVVLHKFCRALLQLSVFDLALVSIHFCFNCFVEFRYAYAVASALNGVRHILHDNFMLQVCLFVNEEFHLYLRKQHWG